MKHTLLASVGLFAVTMAAQPAAAADMPRPVTKAPAMVAAPMFNWTGFYGGANVGAAWLDKKVTEVELEDGSLDIGVSNPVGTSYSLSAVGVAAGLQAGYNWQQGNWVGGIETDINWANIDRTVDASEPGESDDILRGKVEWFGTLRLRSGIANGNSLWYATGGLAYARFKQEYGDIDDGSLDPEDSFSVSKTRFGWTLGAGVEYAFTPQWTSRIEYLYLDFGRFSAGTTVPDGASASVRDKMHVVRVGLNYRFATGKAPIGKAPAVVTRY